MGEDTPAIRRWLKNGMSMMSLEKHCPVQWLAETTSMKYLTALAKTSGAQVLVNMGR
jgi:hypothetical protein